MTIKLLDASGSLDARRDNSFTRRFEATFYNTGNILFFDALKKHLPSAAPVYGWEDLSDAGDEVVISMANFINPHTDVTAEAATLRRSKADKIVLVGCGAQAATYESSFPLRKDTIEFLSIVSERSKSIGVRGVYTAELLNRNGFKNVRVIGCPSFFESGEATPRVRRMGPAEKVAVGATPSGDHREKTKQLYAYAVSHNASYIAQAETHLLGLFVDSPSESQLADVEFFTNYYCPEGSSPNEFRNWLQSNIKMFFELDEWRRYLSGHDFYVGTRIHGAVAAVQTGCPALTLVIDSRTRELCEYFNYPFVDFNKFDPTVRIEHYYEAADFSNFESTYGNRLTAYVDFLRENGLPSPLVEQVALGNDQTNDWSRDLTKVAIGDAVRIRNQILSFSDAANSADFCPYQAAVAQSRQLTLVLHNEACDVIRKPTSEAVIDNELSGDFERMHPVTEADVAALRGKVMEARHAFSEAVSNYVRLSGQNPEFLLGDKARPTSIAPDKLLKCEVLSDRYQIIHRMENDGNVAEVGTQTGLFAKYILARHDKLNLHTIDIDYSLFERDQLSNFIEAGRLKTIKGSSWEELGKFPTDYFSWLYIDASHFYDHVKNDLEAAKDKVKVGGYIICNDYTNWSPFEAENYGVLQAVNEFLSAEDFEVAYFAFHPFGYNDIALRRLS